MIAKRTPNAEFEAYIDLVMEFPLVPIRDEEHLDQATAMIHKLLRLELDRGQEDYLDALTILVEDYEDEHYPMPDAPACDVLRELMRSNKLSQSKLAKAVGIAQSTISEVLSGDRSLTADQVVALAKFFGVGPGAFLPRI